MQTDGKPDAKPKNRLRRRLFASYLMFALIPMVIFMGLASLTLHRVLMANAQDLLSSAAAARNSQLVQWKNALFSDLNAALPNGETSIQLGAFLEGLPTQPMTDDYDRLQERLRSMIRQNQNFDTLFLVNRQGQIILSTNLAQISGIVNDQPYFREALSGAYIQPISYSSAENRPVAYAARPVVNESGEAVGLLVGRINPSKMSDLMNGPLLSGESSETYLISSDSILVTNAAVGTAGTRLQSPATARVVTQKSNGSQVYTNPDGVQVAGAYNWQTDFGVGILAEKSILEIYQSALPSIAVSGITILALVIVVLMGALYLSRQVASPIRETAVASGLLADGDHGVKVNSNNRRDEIGLLTENFNRMVSSINSQHKDLEDQVNAASRQLQHQNQTLRAYTEVTRAATTILDPLTLSRELVELISNRFNLYYTGLFLVDEDREWAILQAGSGEAGRSMLERQHKLAIGEDSMIGWCIANGQERVACEAGEDLVRHPTPELPHTRSEAAIPMRSRGNIIGALSVQSTEPDAFDEEKIAILQALADQVAIAMDNARLFEENRLALENARRAYGNLSQAGWAKLIRTSGGLAFIGTPTRVEQTPTRLDRLSQEAIDRKKAVASRDLNDENLYALAVPIQIADLVLGTLNTFKAAEDGPWSAQEIKLLEEITSQFGLALESSRLYEESQRQAEYEKITGRVTANIRQRLDVETVLRTAAQEVRQALGLPEVTVRLAPVQDKAE